MTCNLLPGFIHPYGKRSDLRSLAENQMSTLQIPEQKTAGIIFLFQILLKLPRRIRIRLVHPGSQFKIAVCERFYRLAKDQKMLIARRPEPLSLRGEPDPFPGEFRISAENIERRDLPCLRVSLIPVGMTQVMKFQISDFRQFLPDLNQPHL